MKNKHWLLSILTLLVLVSVGCRTTKPPAKVSTTEAVAYKDTTIYIHVPPIYIPGDSVTVRDTIPCPDVDWKKTAQSNSGRTTVKAEINKGVITIDCNTDSLIHENDSLKALIKIKETTRTTTVEIPFEVPKPYIPIWIWAVVGVCALIVFIALKR